MAETMKGALLLGPEQVEVRELPIPRPGPGEVVLRVDAATTCGTDVKVFRRGGHPRMLKVPTLFGHEMAGTVAMTGSGVTILTEGDRVVVGNSAPCLECSYCKVGRENLCQDLHYLNGAFAEYILVPARFVERNTHRVPDGMAMERAALTEPLACVLHGLDACEMDRYARSGPVEAVVFGGGPIGLLFIGALAVGGHRPILADPNPPRLEAGRAMGAVGTVLIGREAGQAEKVRAATSGGAGAWVAVDATGAPQVWVEAVSSVRPGGLVNFFGGCAQGTSIELDTHLVHYSELTLKGVYHHRPETIRRALDMLADPAFPADVLISARRPIEQTEEALRSMIRRETLKVVISGTEGG
ncbi:zinc-dependent alcohol dehydrogenase [Roseospirillum parvum]|uniref:L-iditol 2-dehydrogenase n=1 Tax=Roseospirillum parvum TaxID=83401 RepID=A0A1G7XSP6_9PROT|nr:alcohol dehydrogenase catalytic domain-containing protein [Roseospirillum parvum]SDG87033.1 L-iditol 2-dehydrogenase [Roseospirillum parvum]